MTEFVLHLPDQLAASIELRARLTGRSVEEVLRQAVEQGLLLDAQGRSAVAAHIRAMTPGPVTEDSTAIIRRLRDAT